MSEEEAAVAPEGGEEGAGAPPEDGAPAAGGEGEVSPSTHVQRTRTACRRRRGIITSLM